LTRRIVAIAVPAVYAGYWLIVFAVVNVRPYRTWLSGRRLGNLLIFVPP
jgi:hypothetical protein